MAERFAPTPFLEAFARRLADTLTSHVRTGGELPVLHETIERELVQLWNRRGAADLRALDDARRPGGGGDGPANLTRVIKALDR